MKMRKFWKKFLRVRVLLSIVLLIAIAAFVVAYTHQPLDANKIEVENMEFSKEGFAPVDVNNMNTKKLVGETAKYKMFINEDTTIITTVVKTSLKQDGDANNPDDYAIKYSSANTSANALSPDKSNFSLAYSSADITEPLDNQTIDSYSSSVNAVNGLTGENEKHYELKYIPEEKAVQIYYTIGSFGSLDAYFPKNIYSTMYEPAKCLYYELSEDQLQELADNNEKVNYEDYDTEELTFNEAAYEAAMEEYELYLEVIGSYANTFEERFRGNVQTYLSDNKKTDDGKSYLASYINYIDVHSIEARDYLIDVVFPEMRAEGFDIEEYDKETLDREARQAAHTSKSKVKVSFRFTNIPVELIDYNSEYYKKYFNNENSPLTNNPFLTSSTYNSLSTSYFSEVVFTSENRENPDDFSYFKFAIQQTGTNAAACYNAFYLNEQKFIGKTPVVIEDENGELIPFASSGFPARDEEGKFLYDENGDLVKQLYSTDLVAKDNSLFSVDTIKLPLFQIALEFKLTDEGMVVTIPRDSLVDSSNVTEDNPLYDSIKGIYQIDNISLCGKMTEYDHSQDGYIIVPDGSGAIINFHNDKISNMNANYYGNDLAYASDKKVEESAKLLLGMFAVVNTTETNPGGLLAIIEKGGGQASLTAGVDQDSNYAYFRVQLRGKEKIITGTIAEHKEYTKYDKMLTPNDIVLKYLILDETETEYTKVAKKYQNYLIQRDGLTFKDNTNTLLNDLTFLGAFDRYALLMGIKYMTTDTLTTFDQAQVIMDELMNNNVKNMSVSYRGWTSENLEYELGGSLKVANRLGKTASMRTFYKYCVEKGVAFYPELSITTAKGYDYLGGNTKFTSRGVGNEEAIHYVYDLSTGRENKKLNPTYVISPLYYKSITEKLIADFEKLNIWNEKASGGFYLSDLGNQWSGNYRLNRQVYGGDAILYQQEALAMLGEGNKIKIEAPCDYAFKYVDVAVGVPVNSAMYTIYDATIPFYQLVVNGLFDYTTENINGLSNRSSAWYLAKALESGSNLSYIISAEDPAILLDTDYTQYYQAYYNNWKEIIIEFTNVIDGFGIHNCYLTNHELIDGLSRVTYTDKTNPSKEVVLVINLSNIAKSYNGVQIPGYGYIKEK